MFTLIAIEFHAPILIREHRRRIKRPSWPGDKMLWSANDSQTDAISLAGAYNVALVKELRVGQLTINHRQSGNNLYG